MWYFWGKGFRVNISKKGLFIIVVVWYIDEFIFMDDIWVLGLELYVV